MFGVLSGAANGLLANGLYANGLFIQAAQFITSLANGLANGL